MTKKTTFIALLLALLFVGQSLMASSSRVLEQKSRKALEELYRKNPKARDLGDKSVGILVFPDIIKAGLIVGGQRGDGVLFRRGRALEYYNTTAASYGLQLGIQKFGYALFFMNEKALGYLHNSDGFEVGGAPNLTVVDVGMAAGLSTMTIHKDIYAFFFNQKGLMAGLSLQGTKITEYTPSN